MKSAHRAERARPRALVRSSWQVQSREIPLSTSLLLLGVLFSSIGVGFMIYGRKQRALVPMACGLCLLVVPYFFSSALLLFLVGSAFVAIPYFVRL